MSWYLGIDGGGTRTRAVVVSSDGVAAGAGGAGPSNYHNTGMETAARNLRAAADAAWADAGLKARPAEHAFLGCAGVKARGDMLRVRAAAESAGLAPAGAVTVMNDLYNAHAGGLRGEAGVALIAGTGTNCLGIDRAGGAFMCGGWGWLLDDEGGAFGLALNALRTAARVADKRAADTRLLPAAMAFLGLSEPDDMLARFYAQPWTPAEIAAFAPVVTRLASEGDATAHRLLVAGARALAGLVAGASRALVFPRGPQVVLLGSCARGGAPYQPLIEAEIRKLCPSARIVEPKGGTLHGAALNALRAGGVIPPPPLDFSKITQNGEAA
jgi:N-acetylglucosamine kinase-like BadF-type ATPase